jgi:hypothetical protein
MFHLKALWKNLKVTDTSRGVEKCCHVVGAIMPPGETQLRRDHLHCHDGIRRAIMGAIFHLVTP